MDLYVTMYRFGGLVLCVVLACHAVTVSGWPGVDPTYTLDTSDGSAHRSLDETVIVLIEEDPSVADQLNAEAEMDAEQVQQLMDARKAAAAARAQVAEQMSEQLGALKQNETGYANFFFDEVARIEANYTRILQTEKFRMEKPYILQAAAYIAKKFQEAAVVHEVGKVIDGELQAAQALKYQNLDRIAKDENATSHAASTALVGDFISAAVSSVEHLQQTPGAVANNNSVVPGSKEHSDLVDATNVVNFPTMDLGEGVEVVEEDSGPMQNGGQNDVASLVMGIAQQQLDVPQVPVLIDPDDTPADTEPTNVTGNANPYTSILEVGDNSTRGIAATKALVAKEAERLQRSLRDAKKRTWDNEISNKASLRAREEMRTDKNDTMALVHEKLRQALNLDANQTQMKIDEHLLENKVAVNTTEGQRIVLEYSTVVRDMRLNDNVMEQAAEELGRKRSSVVLTAYTQAYLPLMEYQEEQVLAKNAKTQAEYLVRTRLDAIKAEQQAAAESEARAELDVQKSVTSSGNSKDAKQLQIDQKVNQVYDFVNAYGNLELKTNMKKAMGDLKLAKLDIASGSRSAFGAAAAAQAELDSAIALASSSIAGSIGAKLLKLKIEIDDLKRPSDSLRDELKQEEQKFGANTPSR